MATHSSIAAPPALADDNETRVLREANALLQQIGFGARQFAKFEDLVASVSSMSVALYEKLFQFRLERIVRVPTSLAHYEANAQLVVDALAGALLEQRVYVRGVTGESLCAGDTHSIELIVRMFEQIFGILEEANSRGEQAHFATPSSRPSVVSGGVSFSERRSESVSQSVSLKPLKRLTKKKKKVRSLAPRARLNQGGMASDSDSNSDYGGARRQRPSRLEKQHASRRQRVTGDANMYETSDVSITRSRGGDLSARRGRGATATLKHTQARSTGAVGTATTSARQADMDKSSDAVLMKKRSRRLNQSLDARPQQQQVDSADQTKAARSKLSKSASHQQHDTNLLETQKYGRFVPVARQSAGPVSSGSEEDSEREFPGRELEDGEQMYFGGVSSVSNGGSGSEKSVHFIEEDDDVSRDFGSIVDLQNVAPNALHSPSNAYDDDRRANAKAPVKRTNQEEEEQEEEKHEEHFDVEPPSSPRAKKLGRAVQPKSAPELSVESRVLKPKDPATALYPLLPRGKAASSSKSQTEFTRYKLYLKDHLQDLRQVCWLLSVTTLQPIGHFTELSYVTVELYSESTVSDST